VHDAVVAAKECDVYSSDDNLVGAEEVSKDLDIISNSKRSGKSGLE
jgi:hypothetical protein